MNSNKSYVVIGGGTGTFSVLSGLKKYSDNITAIVSMADSGGSAKKEKDEWGLLPSSDIRKSLLALTDVSDKNSLIVRKLFEYRFAKGVGLSGMTFGNLLLVALSKITKSQTKAIELAGELLRIKGKVLPVSMDKVELRAVYNDGTVITGEHNIDEPRHDGRLKIVRLSTVPPAEISPPVKETIAKADVLIIGPGGFYTTLIANLVVKGVSSAISKSKAAKIFILNIMTEFGQTYGFTASTFLHELKNYFDVSTLNYVLINDRPPGNDILIKYQKFHAQPVINDLGNRNSFKVISADLLSNKLVRKQPGDRLNRSLIRHDPDKLAKICLNITR